MKPMPHFFMKKQSEVILDESDVIASGDDIAVDTEKGRLTQITFKTNRNRGNMEHDSVELVSTVGPTEDVEEVYTYLKQTAEFLLDA